MFTSEKFLLQNNTVMSSATRTNRSLEITISRHTEKISWISKELSVNLSKESKSKHKIF